MFQSVGLNNFRGFIDKEIEFSRINILIGENSSGKSSLIKFLLALKQTLEEPDISNLILNGNLVDLGNFKESISFHEDDRNIFFRFGFGNEIEDLFKYFFNADIKNTENKDVFYRVFEGIKNNVNVTFELSKDLGNHKSIKTTFHNDYLGDLIIEILESKKDDLLEDNSKCRVVYKSKDSFIYVIDDVNFASKGFLSIIYTHDFRSSVEAAGYGENIFYEIASFLLCQNLLDLYIKNIEYLNPLTTKPQRIYFKKDAQSSYKDNNLEKFANLVTNNSVDTKALKDFSKILSKFGIVDDIKFSISKNFPVAEIKVKIDNVTTNIYDVGYGVSLQIPLLFESYIGEKNNGKTFIIEQPEIHLHPRLQARFIDTLLSMGNKNNYIIETHSEHIVRMLQVIVKEKKHKISSDSVRIYYFSKSGGEFKISEHKILDNGQLEKPFPSGFYDSSYLLTKSLMF